MGTSRFQAILLVTLPFAFLVVGPRPAVADDAPDGGAPAPLQVQAWAEGDFSVNTNNPRSGRNFTPGVGTSASREGTLTVEDATLDVQRAPDPIGGHLTLTLGQGMEVLRAVEPAPFHYLYQATLAWKAPVGRGLLIEGGIYPAHVGFESFFIKDDWSWTRGWLAELSPYYECGLKVTYAFTDHFTAQLQLLNGWSNIADNNRAKSLGTALTWSGARGSLGFNTILGPELPGDDLDWRYFGDVVAVLSATSSLNLAAEVDAGLQRLPGGHSSTWQGLGGYVRKALGERVAVALRGEYFHDPEGVLAPSRSLAEGTGTLELRPASGLIFRLEGRYDHSTEMVFDDSSGPADHQLLFAAGASAQF